MPENNVQDNKRIAKSTVYLYIRMIVSLAISLYSSRAILLALGVEDYGIYNIVAGFVAILDILTSTLTSAAQRFITYELGAGNAEKLKKTFVTFFSLSLILSVIIVVAGFSTGAWLVTSCLNIPEGRCGAAIFIFYCAVLLFACKMMEVPFIACVIANEKMDLYAIIGICESVAKLLIIYVLHVTVFDRLEVYGVLLVMVSFSVLAFYLVYANKKFEEVHIKIHVDKDIFHEIFALSVWVIYGGGAMVAKEQGVNMLINSFWGVTMNAARGVSIQILSVLIQFANSIATAINPQITKAYASNNLQRAINLTFVLTKAQGIMLLLIVIPLYAEVNFILQLWLNEVPFYTEVFAQWAIIIAVVTTLRQTYGALYLATGKVRYLEVVGGTIVMLNLPISYIVLKMGFEPVLTMVINVIMEILCMLYCYGYMSKILNFPTMKYYEKAILPLMIVAAVSYGSTILLQMFMPQGWLRLLFEIIITAFLTTGLSYFIVLNNSERTMAMDLVMKKFKIVAR